MWPSKGVVLDNDDETVKIVVIVTGGAMPEKEKMTIDERWKYLRIMRERYREADRKGRTQLPKVRRVNVRFTMGRSDQLEIFEQVTHDDKGPMEALDDP